MEGFESRSLCRSLVIRFSGMSGGDGDVWLLFGIPGMRVFWSESRLLRCPSGETLPCFYPGSATSGWLSRAGDVSSHSGPGRGHCARLCGSHWKLARHGNKSNEIMCILELQLYIRNYLDLLCCWVELFDLCAAIQSVNFLLSFIVLNLDILIYCNCNWFKHLVIENGTPEIFRALRRSVLGNFSCRGESSECAE